MTNTLPAERLLLLACSGLKHDTLEPIAPIELYQGVMYDVLRKWMPELDRCEIRILSAKHGLVTDQWPKIPTYNERMSKQKAQAMIEAGLFEHHDGGVAPYFYLRPARGHVYREIFLAAGAEYRGVFKAWILEMQARGMVAADAVIVEVHGGIGEQRSQLGAWLRSIAAPALELEQVAA